MKITEPQVQVEITGSNTVRTIETLVLFAAFLTTWILLLVARWILPWHSGAASVWMIVLGFFVCVGSLGWLLGAWFGAHLRGLVSKSIQLVLLVGMGLSLPIAPGSEWMVAAPTDAAALILRMLATGIGPAVLALTYFFGASFTLAMKRSVEDSVALVRSWILGSIISLLVFLFFLDPLLTNQRQNIGLSWCVLAFVVAGGWWVWREDNEMEPILPKAGKIGPVRQLLQVGLSGSMVAFLLTATLRLQRDAVASPVIWISPLLIFLVCLLATWVRPDMLKRPLLLGLFLGGVALLVGMLLAGFNWGFESRIAIIMFALAASSLVAFRELLGTDRALLKIGVISRCLVGAVLGSVAIVVVAPRVSTGYTEYPVSIFVLFVFVWLSLIANGDESSLGIFRRLVRVAGGGAVVALGFALYTHVYGSIEGLKGRIRTFHGVTSSVQVGTPPRSYMVMMVGDYARAAEFMSPDLHLAPAFWQGPTTGVGQMFRAMPKGNFRNIGIIGVGNGGLMGYLDGTDRLTFYEHDAGVVVTANQQFAYFPSAMMEYEFVPGDPRLTLSDTEPQKFDVLILDALNAESLPVHLLTVEAFEIWSTHLAEDGVMAVNITNDKFDLAPIVWRQALEVGWETILISNPDDPTNLSAAAEWLILTNNKEFLRKGNFRAATPEMSESALQFPLWTDESSNPLSLTK